MYPHLDISRMLELPRCAVRCSSEDEARALIYNIRKQFPDMATHWTIDENHWNEYKMDTCYTLFYSGMTRPQGLCFYYIEWYLKNNYEIVEFADLCNQVEIEESEMSIDVLLCGLG